MNIAHSESTPWQPTPSLRGGVIRFKTLLNGREGSLNNFSLVLADTQASFKSPRHRHNFDQLRVTLEGSTNYGPRENIETDDLAYFPEGTYYGPQDQALVGAASLAMVVQFGGASGNGYMSQRQLFEGHERLQAFGRFEGGVFRREAPAADGRRNQDAYEAIWEYQNGRALAYPKPRLSGPVHFHAANVPWQPVPDAEGVATREFGAFTERSVRIGGLRLQARAEHALPPLAQERIVFFMAGGGGLDGDASWSRHTAVHLAADEAARLRADADTQALVLTLPLF